MGNRPKKVMCSWCAKAIEVNASGKFVEHQMWAISTQTGNPVQARCLGAGKKP